MYSCFSVLNIVIQTQLLARTDQIITGYRNKFALAINKRNYYSSLNELLETGLDLFST